MIDIKNIRIMFGTGASSAKSYEELYPLIDTALQSGIRGFDAAPSYGTEKVLSKALLVLLDQHGLNREDIFIQTKIDPIQMQNGNIKEYFLNLLQTMNLSYIDSLLIHWPVVEYFNETWKEIRELKDKGLVRYIGICNLRMRQLKQLNGLPVMPDIVQIERHPLRTCNEEVAFCKENGIVLQAYSPLCKFAPPIRDSESLRKMAEARGMSAGQLILLWHMNTGAVPIFTSKRASRITEYAFTENLQLTEEEIETVNGLNRNYKLYLESLVCPGI